MNITKTFALTPVMKNSVVYIEWAAGSNPDDKTMTNRWNKFSSKHCAGRDGLGKYYNSTKAAALVIRAFRMSVKQSEEAKSCMAAVEKVGARKKAVTKRQLGAATKMPKSVSLFARATETSKCVAKLAGRQPLSIEKLRALEAIVVNFIDFHHIGGPEDVSQNDDVIVGAYELIEKLGRIAGFYECDANQPEEDD